MLPPPPSSTRPPTLFPYPSLFRSQLVRPAVPVAKLGQLCEVALRGERPCLRVDLLGQIAAGSERVRHLLKGGLYRPLIGRNGNVLARLGDVEIGRIDRKSTRLNSSH